MSLRSDGSALSYGLSFQLLNRQLVWEELSDTLLVLLPALASSKARHVTRLPRFSLSRKKLTHPVHGARSLWKPPATPRPENDFACRLCGRAEAGLPCRAQPCGHGPYCYVCLAAHCRGEPAAACAVCNRPVTAVERLIL